MWIVLQGVAELPCSLGCLPPLVLLLGALRRDVLGGLVDREAAEFVCFGTEHGSSRLGVACLTVRVGATGSVTAPIRVALRARIKRLPRSRKYPPDKSEQAVRLVIEQMEVLAPGYSGQPAEMSD